MHGVSEQDEIAYWRERAEKAERERDEARLVAATSERESIAYREHLSTLSWAATELRRLEGISVDDTQIATLVVDHARMRDENERLTRERDEARKLAADAAHQLANERQVVADLRTLMARAVRLAKRFDLSQVNSNWACAQCRPYSDMLKAGFVCDVHALRALDAEDGQ